MGAPHRLRPAAAAAARAGIRRALALKLLLAAAAAAALLSGRLAAHHIRSPAAAAVTAIAAAIAEAQRGAVLHDCRLVGRDARAVDARAVRLARRRRGACAAAHARAR